MIFPAFVQSRHTAVSATLADTRYVDKEAAPTVVLDSLLEFRGRSDRRLLEWDIQSFHALSLTHHLTPGKPR